MSPLRKVLATVFIVGTLTVSSVACGSDDSSKSDDKSKSSDTSTSNDSSDAAESSDSSDSSDAADSSDSSESAASIETWCKTFEQFDEQEQETGLTDDETMALLEDLDADAPEEISDDMNVFATVLREMASVDFEDEEAMKAVEEKYADDAAVNDRIEAFRADNCGSNLDTD